MSIPVGALFSVKETIQFKVGERVVANYIPALCPYRVTSLNSGFVKLLLDQGKAAIVGIGPAKQRAGGFAKTGS